MGGFSVDLHFNLTIGEGGYIRMQERDGQHVDAPRKYHPF